MQSQKKKKKKVSLRAATPSKISNWLERSSSFRDFDKRKIVVCISGYLSLEKELYSIPNSHKVATTFENKIKESAKPVTQTTSCSSFVRVLQ